MTERSIARALEALEGIEADRLEIMLVEGDLVLNKEACRDAGLHGKSMIRRLERKGISRVDFFKDVAAVEVQTFLSTLLHQAAAISSTPCIKVGAISVRTARAEEDTDGGAFLHGLEESGIDRLKEIYSSISPFKRLEVVGLEEIIAGFVLALKQEANILKMISPVKSYSEYTYTHAANVALLSLCQAESLGVEERLLHDVGIAALMHDVGKLFISREVLHKKGSLAREEFEEMKRHPSYGAYYLSGIDGLSRLVPLAAFEHHRKFDGSGYPDSTLGQRRQHECSQMIAISDFFDALRSNRPYREGWKIERILGLMREEVGTSFSPVLLSNFEAILLKALGSLESRGEKGDSSR